MRNPLQMLYLLKQRGPNWFEQQFGSAGVLAAAGDEDANDEVVGDLATENNVMHESLLLTDICRMTRDLVAEHRALFSSKQAKDKLAGQRLLLASTDVHEHAISALAELLCMSGAEVINLGAEQDAGQVMTGLQLHQPDVLLLSTHNGMALEYAQQLRRLMDGMGDFTPVLMGGVLNQKVEGESLPVPVSAELKALGFRALDKVERLLLE